MVQGAVMTKKGQGRRLQSMVKHSQAWRKVQGMLQWSWTMPKARRKRLEPRQDLIPRGSKIGQSGVINQNIRFL
jgi:hypothetical protein